MALVKRTYVDGETIITAQNLNDIQDEIISHANTFVPKTRTINSKALDANITLTASDLGAVPTTRTVNSKALSSNITLTAADVSAVPTTRTVNSKALSSNITLTSDDIGYNSSTTYTSGSVGKAVSDLNGAITHKLNVYETTTASSNGVPTNAEVISSMSLSDDADSFAVKFKLSNGTVSFTIIWSRLSAAYGSGIGFGYYEYSGYSLLRYKIQNGTLSTYDYYTTVNTTARIAETGIAPCETTTTASRNYAVGEYVIVDGYVYRVKTAISSGATFTVGTNIELSPVGDNIEWGEVPLDLSGMASNITNRGCFCRKFGKMVFLNIDVAVTGSSSSSMGAILPAGYRPYSNVNAVMADGTGNGYVTVLINGYGNVTIYPKGSGYCQGSVTFMADQ